MDNIITETNVQESTVPTEKNKMTVEEFMELFEAKKNFPTKEVKTYYIETDNNRWDDLEADEYLINGNFIIFKKKGETVLIVSSNEFQYCHIAED